MSSMARDPRAGTSLKPDPAAAVAAVAAVAVVAAMSMLGNPLN